MCCVSALRAYPPVTRETGVRFPAGEPRTCHFCGKFGHLQANCRNRLGSCFGCGERGHFRRDCTNNGNRGGQVSGDSFRRYSRSQSVSPRGSRNMGYERFRSVNEKKKKKKKKKKNVS